MIKNLIFDFGKVLVDYDFDLFFKKYIPNTERREKFTPILHNNYVQQLLDREAQPLSEIMGNLISQYPEYKHEIRLFSERYTEIITNEIDGMHELLTQLKREGFKLYGLSNWCSRVYETIEQFEIFNLLDGYIVSCEEKVIKPEPEIYLRLFNRFNLNPSECIFTDDKIENIEGSKRMGMEGIVFQNTTQYEQELRQLLLTLNAPV